MKYSIILPCKDEEPTIKTVILQARKVLPDAEIIVVDNGSKDNSVNLAKAFRTKLDLCVIQNKDNLGFAEANNEGVRESRCDYCLLLNNDTIVEPKFVEDVLSEIQSHGKPALLGIDTLDPKGRMISSGDWTMSILLTNVSKAKAKIPFYFAGCSVVLDKSRLGEPFDKDYFIYGEDTALGWRARLMGQPVAFTTKPKVTHFQGSTGKHIPDRVAYLGQRNRIINFFVFYSRKNVLRLFPLFFASLAAQFFYELFTFRASARMRLKAFVWIISNFPSILKKRNAMQKLRKANDDDITTFMTSKVVRSKSGLSRLANNLSRIYCRFAGIPVIA